MTALMIMPLRIAVVGFVAASGVFVALADTGTVVGEGAATARSVGGGASTF